MKTKATHEHLKDLETELERYRRETGEVKRLKEQLKQSEEMVDTLFTKLEKTQESTPKRY